MMKNSSEITQILQKTREGSGEAYRKLFPLIYGKLKEIAGIRVSKEYKRVTLSKTGLIHEAYLRLVHIDEIEWQDRAHFFAMASQCMRRILIDHARKKRAEKRGGNKHLLTYYDGLVVEEEVQMMVDLDDALRKLGQLNERLVKVVECLYFGEMTIADTAEALGISASTVKRDWAKARGILYRELKNRF
ncbi:MAG: ECF-type sigma factor [Candidatus Halalkalibacterium sp. M3_1C_030]